MFVESNEAEILSIAETPVGGPISAVPNWRFLMIHSSISLSTRFRDSQLSSLKAPCQGANCGDGIQHVQMFETVSCQPISMDEY